MSNPWYKDISVYHIWIRSFFDSNGDGIGDLNGVFQKLDYIKSLNVDAIWFSPLYPSPNADYGYDISDYKNINPEFGNLDDFKAVLDKAHKLGLKVIMDLVINHTSDEHEWFKKSRSDINSKYHNYYFWRKGSGLNPPNNWLSLFEGNAWEYEPDIDEYYLHIFSRRQPDLNMDNPQVRAEIKSIIRFWLDMGVDGFREDVINYISKRDGLPDGFPLPFATGIEHYTNGPNLKKYLNEFKKILDEYDCFTVGEAPTTSPRSALKLITEGDGQLLNMIFSFQHMEADCIFTDWIHRQFNVKKMKKAFSSWQNELKGKAWNALYIENHDHARIISRYGNEKYNTESGKMLAAMYILLSGTPFIYQGQEIGMTNIPVSDMSEYKDVLTFNFYRIFKRFGFKDERILKIANICSRENSRTPVQWNKNENAGFTTGTPWFKVNPNHIKINVEDEEKDPDSLLNFYRKLLRFRKENSVVRYGDYREHCKNSKSLYVYERNDETKRLLVICSFTQDPVKFISTSYMKLDEARLEFCNYSQNSIKENGLITRPYEVRVYSWEK